MIASPIAAQRLATIRRTDPQSLVVVAAVVLLGTALVVKPIVVLAVLGLAGLVGLAAIPLRVSLPLLVGVTAVVPFEIQNRYGIGGGAGSPGLILSDALVIAVVARALPQVLRAKLSPRPRAVLVLVVAFLVVAGVQFLRSLAAGTSPSDVGAEFRTMLGFATVIPAIIVVQGPDRRRAVTGFAVVGLVLGAWGLAQWIFGVDFLVSGDAGIREGVQHTTSGRGQIQGGLFVFPVAILLALAALVSGLLRTPKAIAVAVAVILLNSLSLLLTFERTFWVATALGSAMIILKAGRAQRAQAAIWAFVVLVVFFALLAAFLPGELTTARERLLSLSQYGSDRSVHYRIAETRHVVAEVRASPLIGAGFGASIFWGRPWEQVPPQSYTYSHNGYVWLLWKLGIPCALVLWAAVGVCLAPARAGPRHEIHAAMRVGAQATLIALAVISITFPSFSQLSITPTIGVLLALASVSSVPRRSHEARESEA